MLLVTVIAQFTAKITNSEKAIYFLSLMPCSINKLKSHMFFTCKNFMFSDFTWKKIFCSRKWWGRGGWDPLPPFTTVLSTDIKMDVSLFFSPVWCYLQVFFLRFDGHNTRYDQNYVCQLPIFLNRGTFLEFSNSKK